MVGDKDKRNEIVIRQFKSYLNAFASKYDAKVFVYIEITFWYLILEYSIQCNRYNIPNIIKYDSCNIIFHNYNIVLQFRHPY